MISRSKIGTRVAQALTEMYAEQNPIFALMLAMAKKASGIDRAPVVHGAIRLPEGAEYIGAVEVMQACGLTLQNTYHLPRHKIIASAACPDPLAHESFRMFMSMLRVNDAVDQIVASPKTDFVKSNPQLFREKVSSALDNRSGINTDLLILAQEANENDGLPEEKAHQFIGLVINWLKMNKETHIDQELYNVLVAEGSDVLADVICFDKTHLNHLTPQILVNEYLRPVGANIEALTLQVQRFFDLVNEAASNSVKPDRAVAYLQEILGPEEYSKLGLDPKSFIEWANLRNDVEQNAARLRGSQPLDFMGLKMIDIQGCKTEEGVAIHLRQVSNKGVPVRVDGVLHMAPFVEFEQRGYWLTQEGEKFVGVPENLDRLQKLSCQQLCDQGLVYHHRGFPLKYPGFLPENAANIFRGNLTHDTDTRQSGGAYDREAEQGKFIKFLECHEINLANLDMHVLAARTLSALEAGSSSVLGGGARLTDRSSGIDRGLQLS